MRRAIFFLGQTRFVFLGISSKPTSQNVTFPNLPTFDKCQKQQRLKTYIPKRCLSKSSTMPTRCLCKSSYMPKNSKSSNPTSQKLYLSKSVNMPRTGKAQNLHPRNITFPNLPTCQHVKSSKSSKPSSQNGAFPNLPTCQTQKQLKTYNPKRCLSASSKMQKTCMSSTPTFQNVAFPNLPTCECQTVVFPHLPTCLKQQKLNNCIPKNVTFPNLYLFGKCQKQQKSSKPTSQNVTFPNLTRNNARPTPGEKGTESPTPRNKRGPITQKGSRPS